MPPIRVLIVDDAVVIRRIVSETVAQDPEFELAGWASNGKVALSKLPHVAPDCVVLDVEMPELDGIQTLIEIRKSYPRLPVIMFSTLTERGAEKTLEALAHGATDYATKPSNVGNVVECIERLVKDLLPKIKSCVRQQDHAKSAVPSSVQPPAKKVRTTSPAKTEIICIACSTGGPQALSVVIPALPADLSVPVVIVQHMPPMFTGLLADRLGQISSLPVHEAEHGSDILPGHVYLAPGGKHLEVQKGVGKTTVQLTTDPPENSCRPAADVLFRSVTRSYGGAVLGVVLTGMGQDGLRGCRGIVEAGGQVLAQDQATSVVWGMPGAVTQAGIAAQVLPLNDIGPEIVARLRTRVVSNGL